MKKIISSIFIIALVLAIVSGCSSNTANKTEPAKQSEPAKEATAKAVTLKVGATPVPHREILEIVKPLLEKENIKLEIVEFQDYVQPNTALADKELDANFFQHKPYLDDFNKEKNLSLVPLSKVHVEPLGLYSRNIKNISGLKDGSTIAIPNDSTNSARALLLLQANGIIKLKDGIGIAVSEKDITENPKNLKFELLEAAQLPRILEDVDAAVINTNFALQANLNPTKDALILEGKDSPYVNILVVRQGDQNREELIKLGNALNSPEVKEFIEGKYKGAIVPAF